MGIPRPPADRPSSVRYAVLGLLTSMAVLLYLDRICIAQAEQRIREEFGLSKVEMGYVFGAFFLAYGLAQVPTGWLGDRLGARAMLAGSVLAWSVLTGLTALATGFGSLLALRLLFGLAQAGAYPTAARVNSLWMPFRRRAFASGIITLGGRAGGALAPALTAWLMVRWDGWRPVFYLYAVFGGAWALAYLALFRNTPARHAGCNALERALIESGRPAGSASPDGRAAGIPWGAIVASRSLWMQCGMQLTGTAGWTFLITWLPGYLREAYHTDLETSGRLASLPLLGGVAGCLLGGVATDYLTRRLGLRWGRSLLGLVSRLVAAGSVLACLAVHDAVQAALVLTFSSFIGDLGLGATWAYFQDTGGPYVGTLLGWANMFGNIGAMVAPVVVGWLAQDYGWPSALAMCGGLYFISAACWLGIDARIPIVPESPRGAPRGI